MYSDGLAMIKYGLQYDSKCAWATLVFVASFQTGKISNEMISFNELQRADPVRMRRVYVSANHLCKMIR